MTEKSLAYARENRANRPLIEAILQKAAEGKGVTHREAAVLLECELEDLNQRMFTLAKQIKEKIYGNRIVMFAPLYLSNYCVNGCVYCPYHAKNKHISTLFVAIAPITTNKINNTLTNPNDILSSPSLS